MQVLLLFYYFFYLTLDNFHNRCEAFYLSLSLNLCQWGLEYSLQIGKFTLQTKGVSGCDTKPHLMVKLQF